MKKTFLAATILLILFPLASAASNNPRHPLSQIHPTDTDFNMSGYQIFNASSFELQNGLNLSGYAIYDQGGVKILEWDSVNSEWDVQNADIDLNGGSINDSSGTLTLEGKVEVPNGRLDIGTGSEDDVIMLNSTAGSGTRLLMDNGNNGAGQFGLLTGRTSDEFSISRFQNDNDFSSKTIAVDTSDNVQIPNGDLDVQGHRVLGGERYVKEISSQSGTDRWKLGEMRDRNFGGKLTIYQAQDQGDGAVSAQEVYISKRGDNAFAKTRWIGKQQQPVDVIVTETNNDTNGDSYKDSYIYTKCADFCDYIVRMEWDTNSFTEDFKAVSSGQVFGTKVHTSSNDYHFRTDQNDNVEIPNGNLDLSDNNLNDVDNINQDGSNFFGGCSSGNYVESISSDGSVNCVSDTDTDNQGIDDVLDQDNTVSSGGTNNIDMNGQGNILNGAICPDGTCGGKGSNEQFDSGGIGTTSINDGSGGEIDIKSTVELNGNTIDEDDGEIDFGAGANFDSKVKIGSFDQGHLELQSDNSNWGWEIETNDQGGGTVPLNISRKHSGNYTQVLKLTQNSNMELPNGNLDMNDNVLKGAGKVGIGTKSPAELLHVNNTGTGDQDAFIKVGSSGTGENGLLISDSGETLWSIESGDAWSDDLNIDDKDGNSIIHFDQNGQIGIGTTSPGSTLDVDGSAEINGDLDMKGNNITSSTSGNLTIGQDLRVHGDVWSTAGKLGTGGSSVSTLADVLSNNNSAGNNDINMTGQAIIDTNDDEVYVNDSLLVEKDLKVRGSIDETASDLAEKIKKRNFNEEIGPGDVVGIKDGKVTLDTSESAVNMVVSTQPGIVLGGPEVELTEEERKEFERRHLDIAFTGRVPVKIKGEVEQGDYVLPSGEDNGVAVSVGDDEVSFDQYKEVVGVVLQEFEIPEHVSEQTRRKYEKMFEKAENHDYSIYQVAVGVK